jgi:hypothetical protein
LGSCKGLKVFKYIDAKEKFVGLVKRCIQKELSAILTLALPSRCPSKLEVELVFLPQTSCNPLLAFTSPYYSIIGAFCCFVPLLLCIFGAAVVVSSYCFLLRCQGLLIVVLSLCLHSGLISYFCLYSMFLSLLCILCCWRILITRVFKKDYSLELPSEGSREGFVLGFV